MGVLTVTLNPCIDRALYVDKLERNALVRSSKEFLIAGGKGANVARQLVRFGIKASAFVLVGGDTANIYLNVLERDGVKALPYHVDQPTRWQDTFWEESTGRYYTVLQEAVPVPRKHTRGIVDAIAGNLDGIQWLVLSGSTPGDGLSGVYREVAPIAASKGINVILDTYGKALAEGIKAAPFMIKPNDVECEAFLGFKLKKDADFARAFKAFHDYGVKLVLISLGEKGFRASYEGVEYIVSPPKVKEVNAVASGDSLVAGIIYGFVKGMPVEDVLRWGAAAGAANAAVWEVANSKISEVKKLLGDVEIRTKRP